MRAGIASRFTKIINQKAHYIIAFSVLIVTFKVQAEVGYYTIQEQVNQNSYQSDQNNLNPLSIFENISDQAKDKMINLMNWFFHNEEVQQPSEPYKRLLHFGTWKVDQRDSSCFNTRARILERASIVPVELAENGCTVKKGQWIDPYTNETFYFASDIQIDHVVPLKNAYQMGAWQWDKTKRCLYANFRWNEFHLLAVSGHENTSKGDSAPDRYMPPNNLYKCDYLQAWLKIKLIWGLDMSNSEAQAIRDEAQANHCDMNSLKFSQRQLDNERTLVLQNLEMCQ